MAEQKKSFSAKQTEQLGLPDGIQFASPFPFAGMNLEDDRIAIDDEEFYVLENYIKIGKGQLRTLWDKGPNLYSASGKTIISFFWFSVGLNTFCAVFFSDGTAVQVSTTGVVTTISAAPGTFYSAAVGTLPACAQWGTQFLLIANNFAQNNYWAWDGSVLYEAGTISPIINLEGGGSGYTSVPTVTVHGGNGTGVVVVPNVVDGSVVGFQITNAGTGYLPGDVVQLAFSGGGTNSTPILTSLISSGSVAYIELLSSGNGYTAAPTVNVTGGGGTGATATATLSGTSIGAITVMSGGTGYTSTPAVTFTISGSGATASSTTSGGAVTAITVTSGGSGYTGVPTVVIGGSGSGALATAAVFSGQVTTVTIVAGGSGYTGSPSVTFSNTGSGATALAVLTPSTVTGVTIVSGGTGFTSTPTITFVGGGGAGATGSVTVSGGAITSVSITSGGAGYTSPPEILVSAGLNNSAYAQAELMPFVVSGAAIETFVSRVWLCNPYSPALQQTGGNILVSAPGSMSDFATSDGGLVYVANEPFLRQQYYNLKQSQGYLYTFADSSVDVISNVQTSGSPSTTTFTYQNVDPQEGTVWRDTTQYLGLSVIYGNPTGVFGLYGGSIKNVSRKLTRLFDDAIFPPTSGAVTPCSAIANIHTIKCYLMLMTVNDPVTGANRTIMIGWDEIDWFLVSQTVTLSYINTQIIDSLYTAWGTDGTNLFPLLSSPSAYLTKRFSTKLYGANSFPVVKNSDGMWFMTQDVSAAQSGVVFNVTIDSEYGYYVPDTSPLTFPGPVAASDTGNVYGSALGMTVTSTSSDFIVKHVVLGYLNVWGGYGTPPTTTDI